MTAPCTFAPCSKSPTDATTAKYEPDMVCTIRVAIALTCGFNAGEDSAICLTGRKQYCAWSFDAATARTCAPISPSAQVR
jgi:hypothetical protein